MARAAKLKQFPIVVIICHTAIVATIALINGLCPGESSVLWNLILLLDFPASLAVKGLLTSIESWSNSSLGVENTYSITFGVVFAVLGGLQYFLLALLLRRWIIRRS